MFGHRFDSGRLHLSGGNNFKVVSSAFFAQTHDSAESKQIGYSLFRYKISLISFIYSVFAFKKHPMV